ncbi:glutamate-rich protein 3-like isoform X2 [Dreissena polymorpha]|uniref:glutamate-rich protein 3-like isoform X2 n=1 Tax=Dreissena polymorpha TaxID=45954 RepID=UPI002264526D|nr:glutamate-rich protein 3-like isoform X2 [Dreissena polymorpha]
MSHVHEGPLATYNSLTDPNLAGFFGNTRMRRHLRKNGLVNRRGEIISENQYRLNMARKEHKKHVKNLLAQAIVHKTLDLERYRQVEIKKKLEEIAKIEMVRRVRATRGRKGDEELLPYLTPRSHSRPQSGPSDASSSSYKRPKSAPGQPRHRVVSKTFSNDPYDEVIYMDNDGYPVEPPPASERYETKNTIRDSDIDTRHLYALDSEALHQYALRMSKAEKGRDGATSPYLISQYPVPPKSGRPSRSSSGRSRSGLKSPKSGSGRSSPRRSARMSGRPEYPAKRTQGGSADRNLEKDQNTVEGSLMLHRQEPAMMHQGEIQTLCEITMKYHGPNLTLPRDQFDPTQEVSIEQQHCGGNTLPVFKERIQGGSTFSFVSRRHRGYPFSLTVYIDGRVDCRVSTCCEYKHAIGVKLGGKMGHFSLTGITGATPCYKCKLSVQAPPRSLKLKKGAAKKKKEPQGQEEVTVSGTPRTPITEKKQEKEGYIAGKSDDDNYDDDFEDEESKGKYTDDFEDDSKDKRHIIGLRDNETRLNGQTVSVDVQEKEKQDEKEGILPPHRRIEGYSSEDEDAEGRGITYPKADVQKKGQRSSSSSSSSSSRSRSRSRSCSRSRSHSRSRSRSRSSSRSRSGSSSSERPKSPKQPERIIHARPRTPEPSGEKKISREETVQKVVDVSTARSDGGDTARSSGSTSSDLTTETESSPRSLTPKPPVTGGPTKRTRSSSSSSSSTLTSDTEDEKFTRKKREEKIRQENEQRRKQEEEERKKEQEKREQERKQKLQMEEERRQVEEEERKKRFMLQRNESQERLKKMEEDRKAKEAELNRQKEEEKQKRMADEERIKRDFEKQLSFIQSQRESGTATSLSDERKPKIVEKTDIGRTSEQTKRRGSTSSTASSSSSSSSSSGREYVVKKEEKPQPAPQSSS